MSFTLTVHIGLQIGSGLRNLTYDLDRSLALFRLDLGRGL